MARIVLGIGTSHGPMLSMPPEQWGLRVGADRVSKELCYQGRCYAFDELVVLRRPGFSAELALERQKAQLARARAAIDTLAQRFAAARVDLAILVGNDQREIFLEDITPAIAVYHGETIENAPTTDEQKKLMPPGIAVAEPGHAPPRPLQHLGAPAFGAHLVACLMAENFDVATSRRLPAGSGWRNGIPHAYGFAYRQIMRDAPPPSLPIVLNTFYPPNQPSPARCLALGHALHRAIARWPGDERIALVGSGGLSHFVVDEALDRAVLDAMRKRDEGTLAALPDPVLQSGSSEIKNWLPLAAAMNDAGLALELVDYVGLYRSEAGTGNGVAFAVWA
jgi:OH-DDVA oxygenase